MKATLKKVLDKRFKDVYLNKHFVLATALDPRFKMAFLKGKVELVTKYLQNEMEQLEENLSTAETCPAPEQVEGPQPAKTARHASFSEMFDEDIADTTDNESKFNKAGSES